jgi:hypothetical protein
MNKLLLLLGFLSYELKADTFVPASLDKMSLQINKSLVHREPMTPDIDMKDYVGSLNLEWDAGLLNDMVKWRNSIAAAGTQAQFKTIYWEYEVAVPLHKSLELLYNHKSQHVLDTEQPYYYNKQARFPVSDSYGIRIIFFQKENK